MTGRKIAHRTARPVVLDPVRPNVGIEAAYRRTLVTAVERMHRSLVFWLRSAYLANEPELASMTHEPAPVAPPMAHDESPAVAIQRVVRKLSTRWLREFDRLARREGPEFVRRAGRHTDQAFAERMRKAGFTVRFRISRPVNDALQAATTENVALIRSIASQHLTQVEGIVMRGVQHGRAAGELSRELERQFEVTKRRAALIARDQNNKATAVIDRARQLELGITQARWLHSHGGKVPRPAHVEMDGKLYDVAKGMWDKDEKKWVMPGELISCRCVSRPIIEGFS